MYQEITSKVRILVRNSDRLLEPDCRRRFVMYSNELPTSLIQQVSKVRDRALLAVETSHHHDVGIVRHCGGATHVWKKRLGRHGNLCTWYLVCRGLVTCIGHRLFDDDELGLGPSGSTQVLQYGEAIIVSPVMENFGDEEYGDVVLLRRLWVKEVVAYITKYQCESLRWYRQKSTNIGASRGRIRVIPYLKSVDPSHVPRPHPSRRTRGPG